MREPGPRSSRPAAPPSGAWPCVWAPEGRLRAARRRRDRRARRTGIACRPGSDRNGPIPPTCSALRDQCGAAICVAVQRLLGFCRHVVLVVLGQHFTGRKTFSVPIALRNRTFALLEQVGKNTAIAYGE